MQPRDVFIYFDNDAKVRAPFDAQGLMARVSEILRPAQTRINSDMWFDIAHKTNPYDWK
jgi:uncharacterized protein YecE (DUF72 family)